LQGHVTFSAAAAKPGQNIKYADKSTCETKIHKQSFTADSDKMIPLPSAHVVEHIFSAAIFLALMNKN
jgi:hypothetical protein